MKIFSGMPVQPTMDLAHRSCQDVKGRSYDYMTRKVALLTTMTAIATAVSSLYFLLRPSNQYNAYTSYVQKAIKCQGPDGSSVPGCNNHVYCEKMDPTYNVYPGGQISLACENWDVNSIAFAGSKEAMDSEVKHYLSTRYAVEQQFDKVYNDLFL